jgi:hypothetical protein
MIKIRRKGERIALLKMKVNIEVAYSLKSNAPAQIYPSQIPHGLPWH